MGEPGKSIHGVSIHHGGAMVEAGGFEKFSAAVMDEVAESPGEVFFPDRSKFERTNREQYAIIRHQFDAFRQRAEQEIGDRLGLTFEPDVRVKYILYDGAPEYVRNSTGFHGKVRRFVIDGQRTVGVFLSLEHIMTTIPRRMSDSDLRDLREAWGSGGRVVLHEITHSAMDRSSFELMHELPSWFQEWTAHHVARQRNDKYLRVFTNPKSNGMEAYDVFSLAFLEFVSAAHGRSERIIDAMLAETLDRVLKRREYLEGLEGEKEYRLLRQELADDVVISINRFGESLNAGKPPIIRDPSSLSDWIFSGGWQMYQLVRQRDRANELQQLMQATPRGDDALWSLRDELLEFARVDPDNVLVDHARIYAAAAAIALGEHDLALAELEEILSLSSVREVIGTARYFAARALERQGRWGEAIEMIRRNRSCFSRGQIDINRSVLMEFNSLISAGETDEAMSVASDFGSLIVQGAIEISEDDRKRFDELAVMIERE